MPSKGGRREGGETGRPSGESVVEAVLATASEPPAPTERPRPPATADAPDQAQPPLLQDEPESEAPEWARLYSAAAVQHRERREQVEREQGEAQRLWEEFLREQGEAVPEGERSLERNEELHQQLRRLARTASAAAYERENVIGDSHQTFGVEIEFVGADANAVARALYDAGLAGSPQQLGYHSSRRQEGMWSVERDASVDGEVVSPVLRDTPETWVQLERVCSILRAQGARTSVRTGGHVHVGADSANLDHDVNRFRRVAQVCAWAEDLMYRLAAASGRNGRTHRGAGRGYAYCGPMGSADFEQARNLTELAYRVGSSHGVGLNYGHLLEGRRTIEYRYFDASLDPARLQANIKLACWLTKRAGELQDAALPRERTRLGTHFQARHQSDGLLRRFADLVFVRPQDKLKLYWVYEGSGWQRAR